MLSARSIAVTTALALIACHRLSSDERMLVGTWESHSMDAAWRVTFKPDRTLLLAFEDLDSHNFDDPIPGSWHLTGSQLTTDIDLSKIQKILHEKPRSQTMTETITFVGADKIERTGGYPYIRVK